MGEYLASLTGSEKVYLVCALFGGGLFLLRMVLMLMGADHGDMDTDMGMDVDVDADMDAGIDMDAHNATVADIHDADLSDVHDAGGADVDHGDADHGVDEGLRLLTLQGITAFVMMFGLTGYSISRSSSLGAIVSAGLGGAAGLFGMWLVAKGFAVMRSLQSSGTINIYDAVGEEGTVYLSIPAEGVGKVQVTVSGRFRVMDAVSQDKTELKTGERVSVTEIANGRMLSVRRT